jgi:hypothetical protein
MGLGQVFDYKKFSAEACYCYLKALALDTENRLAQERVLTLIKHRPPGALALIDRLLTEHPGHAGLLLVQAASRSPEAQPAGQSARLNGHSSSRRTIGPVTVRVPQKMNNS